MRVALVDPPGWQIGLNVGLAFLAAPLVREGHEVRIFDLNNNRVSRDNYATLLTEFAPDVVGFSVKTATAMNVKALSVTTSAICPEAVQIAGGPHVTLFPERFLRSNPQIRYAMIGECEKTLPVFLQELEAGALGAAVGYATLVDDQLVQVENHAKVELDELMPPNFDVFHPGCIDQLRRQYPLVTSRGCPYRCTFCSVPFISGRKWRKRSAAHLLAEVEHARERYGIQRIEVIDDNFTLNLKHAKEVCRTFIQAGMSVPWSTPNGIRADRLDEELVTLMAQAGCTLAMLGIESGVEEVFNKVDKGEELEDIVKAVALLKSKGLKVGGYFIVGLPGETPETVRKSYAFVRRMDLDLAHFNLYVPYPGTPGWAWARNETTLLRDFEEGFHFSHEPKIVFETPEFTAEQKLEAYRWVNTKIGAFELLVPPDWESMRRHRAVLGLVAKYDPLRLPYRSWAIFRAKVRWEIEKVRRRLVGGAARQPAA